MARIEKGAIAVIEEIFARRGSFQYGECVTQRDHALQCAMYAEQSGALPPLIVAALLHDIGHLLHRDGAAAIAAGDDDQHETIGATYLSRWFGPETTMPIALQVQAKRYLCRVEAGYHGLLSEGSKRSLALRGGPMSKADAAAFAGDPFLMAAMAVRRWDDDAKHPATLTPGLTYFLPYVEACMATARPAGRGRAKTAGLQPV